MGARWIKLAVLYLIIGIVVGFVMAITLQLKWGSAHAHVNLVGFATTAIFGIIYTVYPGAAKTSLGKWHFWLHNIGVPIFLIGAFLVQIQDLFDTAHIFVTVGGVAFGIGVILFIINSFVNVNESTLITNKDES